MLRSEIRTKKYKLNFEFQNYGLCRKGVIQNSKFKIQNFDLC